MNFIQQLDQMQAALRDLSPALASYRDNLIKSGFTRQEAMQLVFGLQQSVLGQDNK